MDIDGVLQMIIKCALPFLLVLLVSFEPGSGKTFSVPMFVKSFLMVKNQVNFPTLTVQ